MTEWKTIAEVERPREVFSDPFMQEVRDKIEICQLAYLATAGRGRYFHALYLDAGKGIREKQKGDDMFYYTSLLFFEDSPEYQKGVSGISLTVSGKDDKYWARAEERVEVT